MIIAIAELGKYEKINNPGLTSFNIWLEDSYDNGKNPHLFLIEFEKEGQKWIFKRIDYRENSTKLKSKLLYKFGSPSGPNRTPTVKGIEVTIQRKIINWFKSNKDKNFLSKEEKRFLNEINKEIKEKKETITKALIEKAKKVNGNKVLSLIFSEDGDQKFIGDYKFFEKYITEESKQSFKYKHGKYSFAKNKTCSVCNVIKDEVVGFFSSLAFYTVDKAGMVTGGFQQDKSWKNYPICHDCILDVETGIKLMKEKLAFDFYGIHYYLIPRTINKRASVDIIENVLGFKKTPRINASDRERLTNDENEVFEIMQEEQNRVILNLFFYEEPQNQKGNLKILTYIEDVVPSRIKLLFKVKKFVENIFVFKKELSKEQKPLYLFSFGILNNIFPYKYKKQKLVGKHKAYLKTVEAVFNNRNLDYSFLIQNLMIPIRQFWIHYEDEIVLDDGIFLYNSFFKKIEINASHIKAITLSSFMFLIYLNTLNLFGGNKEVDMDNIFFDSFKIESKEEFEEKAGLFFSNFKEFFRNDAHCSIFLIGVLAQFLLNIQKKERKATPFRSRLKGLKMDSGDISVLLPEIIEKIEQYKRQYGIHYQYKGLAELTSKYLISSGDPQNWNISVDEMNFIFVLGMNLSQYFKIKSNTNTEGEQEE